MSDKIKTRNVEYVNLYYSTATSKIVTGKNKYNTKQAAIKAQKCPNGFVFLDVATVRLFGDDE